MCLKVLSRNLLEIIFLYDKEIDCTNIVIVNKPLPVRYYLNIPDQ